jgi:DNA-directed RNA polymerase specialized sigma24 family protein
MIKEQIRELLENGADVDDLVVSLIEALHEAIEFKTDNTLKKEPIVITINQLREQIRLLVEQNELNVNIDSEHPETEKDSDMPENASAQQDFAVLEEQITSLEIDDELKQELEIIEQERRNGSKEVNERSEFIRTLHNVYDGFDIDKQPEGKTLALLVSTTFN